VAGIQANADAVMMAHVVYPAVAPEPAGYSPRWLREILRGDMGFQGVIFSDDIGMAAATSAGGVAARIDAHLDAGCDVVLVCAPALVGDSLKAMDRRPAPKPVALAELMGGKTLDWDGLRAEARYDGVRTALSGPDFPVA